jgi:NitT/TauT family transport system ATP-binding protein
VARIRDVLQARPRGSAPRVRFEAELEDHLSEQYATKTLQTAIEWGRYAELYEYDADSRSLLLERAETAPTPPPSSPR